MPIMSSSAARGSRVVGLVGAALLLVGLAACDPAGPTPSSSPSVTPVASPSASATPSPTPSPTPSQSQEEKDQEAAKRAIVALYAALDRVGMDPKVSLKELDKVAAGETLESYKGARQQWRAKGWRQVGPPTRVLNLKASGLVNEQGKSRITVTYCVDVTGVDVIDTRGKSQIGKDRPNKGSVITIVENINDVWLPIQERDGGSSCA